MEHGLQLKAAMSRRSLDRRVVADYVGVKSRTVTNWTSGATMPDSGQRERLRDLLGSYDTTGDPVEVALATSPLTEDRRHLVLAEYKRLLREQATEEAG